MAESLLDRVVRRQNWAEKPADLIQRAVGGFYGALGAPGRGLKNVMHGTVGLGHPLHPAVTDGPVGAWATGVVLDYVAHFTARVPTEAGDIALAVGLVAALLAAVTGYTDFHDTFGQERRIALLHGLAMTLAVTLDAVSMALRWWAGGGAHAFAVGLSTAGFVVVAGGAYLGGHLVFGIGTMVNRNAFAEGPDDFVPLGSSEDYPEGELRAADAGGMRVLAVRLRGRLHVVGDVCSHAGGPLHEGELVGDVVVCPWHQSRFCVRDGRVRGGPATFDQPLFTVREQDGRVEVKPAVPLH